MEFWELVRRLLAAANGGESNYQPVLAAIEYERELLATAQDVGRTHHEVTELAEHLAEQLEEAGLIQPFSFRRGNAVAIGVMKRTELGDELMSALRSQRTRQFFDGCQAQLEQGEIRRLLHQLDS